MLSNFLHNKPFENEYYISKNCLSPKLQTNSEKHAGKLYISKYPTFVYDAL